MERAASSPLPWERFEAPGEGKPRQNREDDRNGRRISFAQHPQILDSHDINSQPNEIPRSMIVVFDRQLIIVTVAIDFYYELQCVAVKVSNVWPDRVLTAKFPIAESSISQPTPNDLLRTRGAFPEIPGALSSVFTVLVHILSVPR